MSDYYRNDFNIIISPTVECYEYGLNDFTIDCLTDEQFQRKITENDLPNQSLVCDNHTLINIKPLLLNNRNVRTIYVVSGEKDMVSPIGLTQNTNVQLVSVIDEKHLMRNLYLKAMSCYFEQGEKFQATGNHGFANLSFLDAKEALKQAERWI